VTKVGRKYLYAASRYSEDLQFDLNPTSGGYWSNVSNYPDIRLYASQDDYEAHQNLVKLRQSIYAYFSGYSASSQLTLEQCEAIAQIVGLELP
jgi:hypothetical protein